MLLTVGIGGEPATGKSRLVGDLICGLAGPRSTFKYGTVVGTRWTEPNVWLVGLGYDADAHGPDRIGPYPGTDRLSMAAQPNFLAFLRHLARDPDRLHRVLFEGDRLFTGPTLAEAISLGPARFFVLTCPASELVRRRHARQDTKPESFVKGRQTKYANLARAHPGQVVQLNNANESRGTAIRRQVWAALEVPVREPARSLP